MSKELTRVLSPPLERPKAGLGQGKKTELTANAGVCFPPELFLACVTGSFERTGNSSLEIS